MKSMSKKVSEKGLTFKQLIKMFVEFNESKSESESIKTLISEFRKQVWILDTLVATSEDDIVLFDKNGRTLFVNEMSKSKLAKLNIKVGNTIDQYKILLSQKQQLSSDLNIVFYESQPVKNEITLKFGKVQTTMEYLFTPVLNEKGKCEFVLSIARNISNYKNNTQELEMSKRIVETILENLGNGINVFSAEGKLKYTNDQGLRMLGYFKREQIKADEDVYKILKRRWKQNIIQDEFGNTFPLERAPVLITLKHLCTAEAVIRLIGKNGKIEAWLLIKSKPVFNNDGSLNMVVNSYTDLTRQKKYEKELYRIKNQLSVIFENVADGIIVYDNKGKIVFANETSCSLLECKNKSEVLKKKNIYNIIDYLQKDLRAVDENGIALSIENSPTLKALNGVTNPGFKMHIFHPSKKKDRWLILRSRPVYDENKKIKLVVNLLSDITEQKEIENRKDEFIGVVSHELKTPLTSIKAYSQILEKKADYISRPVLHKYLSEINSQINRFQNLVLELLDTSKINSGDLVLNKQVFEIKPFLADLVEEFSKVHLKNQFICESSSNVIVEADKTRISQVVVNLLSNAVKYSNDSEKIIIRSSLKSDQVVISVQDFGLGIPKEEQSKIFDRFYQIRHYRPNQDPSLGLGLYLSLQIINLHGGKLWLKSKLHSGSTFSFSLPIKNNNEKNSDF